MTSPLNDNTERIHLWPLAHRVDRESFCNWMEDHERYRITRATRLHLPGYHFAKVDGAGWKTEGSIIDLEVGYEWDGPSGPAINGETNVAGSLAHDIVCTKIGGVYPLPGYFTRHNLYFRINRAQGEGIPRAVTHWTGLVLFNWAYRMGKHNAT